MKIDKTNLAHWACLVLFGLNVLIARLLRAFREQSQTTPTVVLYGHRLNGNLQAIYRYWEVGGKKEIEMSFLTMDKTYHEALRSAGIQSILATRPAAIEMLARVDAVISDHGLHAMRFLLGAKGLHFIDVWHGIPFKGFDPDDFKVQRRYDETWVASELGRDLYVQRFGFDASKAVVTGYARTDPLVRRDADGLKLRDSLGIREGSAVILFAPTWAQDDNGRSIFPFGCDEARFMGALSSVAEAHGAVVLIRRHLNTGTATNYKSTSVIPLPASKYPDTEAILLASDILICDWSSIAFDFMLLNRPAIFLDVAPPFQKGFSLGPEYRYGEVAGNLETLIQALRSCLADPHAYWARHAQHHLASTSRVYGAMADGKATERCFVRLRDILGIPKH